MHDTFQDIIDKTTRLEGAKNDLQKQVDATNLRIKGEDDQINQIQQAGSKVNKFFFPQSSMLTFGDFR